MRSANVRFGLWVATAILVTLILGLFRVEEETPANMGVILGNISAMRLKAIRENIFMQKENNGSDIVAAELRNAVRVLCWILTTPDNHKKKAAHVQATWGRRCNRLIFFSTEEDKELGAVALNMTEDRNHLWQKTKESLKYIYKHHLTDSDWFLKTDDDTYVIMENLRYMLSPFDPMMPLWFGHRFKKFSKQGYMSGGAGYVMSREAVKRFVEKALSSSKLCKLKDKGAEDAELGKCLGNVGVLAMDSRDKRKRDRFFPFVPESHLKEGNLGKNHWYWNYTFYPSKIGIECCSNTPVSFHYVPPGRMYELEYFIYRVRPFGIRASKVQFPPLSPGEANDKLQEATKFFNAT